MSRRKFRRDELEQVCRFLFNYPLRLLRFFPFWNTNHWNGSELDFLFLYFSLNQIAMFVNWALRSVRESLIQVWIPEFLTKFLITHVAHSHWRSLTLIISNDSRKGSLGEWESGIWLLFAFRILVQVDPLAAALAYKEREPKRPLPAVVSRTPLLLQFTPFAGPPPGGPSDLKFSINPWLWPYSTRSYPTKPDQRNH